MRGSHNLLVVSDLHLGEDLNPSATEESIRDLQLAERHLIAFLEHYTRRRSDGLPWRLVIDGDMVDLVRIFLPPEQLPGSSWVAPSAPASASGDTDERKHGLGRRMDASCLKVEAVVGRHQAFVEAFARFLAAGNRVEIVCGNHDAELFWPEVQETLRRGVVQAWQGLPDAGRAGASDADQIAARMGFHDWFYYEPGVAWIEHGHQYDECCSIEHHLYPVAPDGRFLVHNVDSASLRYLTNMVPELAPHGSEDWTMAGYLRLTYEAGPRAAFQIARGYFVTAVKLLDAWRASRQLRQDLLRRDRHLERLRALSAQGPLGEDRLRALCGLHRRPVVTSLRRLLQVLMLDKLLLWPGVVVLVLVAALALPGVWALLSGLGILAAAGLAHHWLGRGRNVNPVLPLDLVPERILEQVDARFVVFGHTHLPVARPLANGRWYFNSGTWMPGGKPGLLRCFTHVLIRHTPEGPVASLCQWRDGASQEFTSTPGPVRRARSPERLATPLGTPVAGRAAAAFSRPPSVPASGPAISAPISGPLSASGPAPGRQVEPASERLGLPARLVSS